MNVSLESEKTNILAIVIEMFTALKLRLKIMGIFGTAELNSPPGKYRRRKLKEIYVFLLQRQDFRKFQNLEQFR